MKNKTYIIGDVHGEFNTLVALIKKLPSNSNLIFVGDLVDRGKNSAAVVKYVRDNNHLCCMGNHEDMMIHYGTSFVKSYPSSAYNNFINMWINNGGKQTLLSYGLIEVDKYDGKLMCIENDEAFEQFKEDIQWMKKLPLYIKIPKLKKDDKKIVISHASCGNVWHHHNKLDKIETFKEYALWNRTPPYPQCDIFNIYGHTIIDKVDTSLHYINVDTGCYMKDEITRELSIYCIEDDVVLSQRRI